ncbi:MAG TPA: hypothetical protein VF777_10055 [Phycisphaerales bacterium]
MSRPHATQRAWVVDARAGDEPIRVCAEQSLEGRDAVVLIADSQRERRAELLGLRTPLVFPPAALRRAPLTPPSTAARSLRETLLGFESWCVAGEDLMNALVRVCGGPRALPPRSLMPEADPPVLVSQTEHAEARASVRAALQVDDAAQETLVGLGCDPDDAVNACDFVRVCQTLSLVGHRMTAVVPRGARELARAKDVVRSTGIALRLLTTEAPVWSLLPGLDAVVLDVAESVLEPVANERSLRWMARSCARVGIPAAIARALAWDVSESGLALAPSRLPVHVARALDAALRGVPLTEATSPAAALATSDEAVTA